MKHKIYKGGVDNYPLWWYGKSTRLQNFGDRTNFLTPHGAVFQGNGYYFNSAKSDYMEDIYGRHLLREGTRGVWSQLYLTDSAVPPCGSAAGAGDIFYLSNNQDPKITGKIVLLPEFCPRLTKLYCYDNQISTLDVSQLTGLTKLYCYSNQISTLDVSQLTRLATLSCGDNQIPTLDISQLTGLATLSCGDNQIPTLDVSQLTRLAYLSCYDNQISTLDVSQLTGLTKLYCYSNQIPTLDVSNDYQITILDCHNNQFDQAAVDKILCDANAWNTSNGTLNISGNTAPSQTGIDAKNDLVDRNWTVTTD